MESQKLHAAAPILDIEFIRQISNKTKKLEAILFNIAEKQKLTNFGPNIKNMIESTTKILQIISNNLDYLNNTDIFKEDFNKSIHVIDNAYEAYIKVMNSITNIQKESKLINQMKINIDNFAQSIIIFSSIFEEIMNEISNTSKCDEIELINTHIGLESALFNFAVYVEPTNEAPFFKSRFIEIYKCYYNINNIKNRIEALKSFCGTGKTLGLPIILLCRSLKDKMNAPFLLITQPSPKHVEYKENFFNQTISKYVTIVSDPDQLEQI